MRDAFTGKSGVEFALILGLVAIGAIASLNFLADYIGRTYQNVSDFSAAEPVFELLDPNSDPTPPPPDDPPLPPNL